MCHEAAPAPYRRRRLRTAELTPFTIDLTFEEARRRAEAAATLGPDRDPVAALRGENEAYALLCSGLDAEQRPSCDRLVATGVLPDEGPGRAAAH
ncbi:DUF6400 family protein [Streptomyces parvus]|uniref:DUF6400 family protein n=1 Tax=Streptomyces parvus TaxID=66428 RepID=UPI003D735D75